MDEIRIGVVGIGVMGSSHAGYLHRGEVENARLTAGADIDPRKLQRFKKTVGDDIATFESAEAMIDSGCVDGVLVATPHYDHPPIGIKALEKGLHVLLEKPVGVYTKQVRELNEVADASGKMFGVMFQERTVPVNQKMKDLLQSDELGRVKRNCWLITSWYRSQSYYDSGGWRATWAGEGGGVLLNQCPHQLDLWQWFCGMPRRVRAFCSFGKYHDIEVEDDVTAYVEYENGATGVFITSTGESPGTNMLEISGEMGKLQLQDGGISFHRNRISERRFNAEYTAGFGKPESWRCEVPVSGRGPGHKGVTQKWVDAIAHNDSSLMIADGREGIRSLELSNAMLMSAWTDDWVELPLDEEKYFGLLEERIQSSSCGPEKAGSDRVMDVRDSF